MSATLNGVQPSSPTDLLSRLRATPSGRLLLEALADRAPDEALRGLPILLQRGLYDQVLPIQHGQAARAALESLPVELDYREYPIGHEVSQQSLADAVEWLSARLDGPRR